MKSTIIKWYYSFFSFSLLFSILYYIQSQLSEWVCACIYWFECDSNDHWISETWPTTKREKKQAK